MHAPAPGLKLLRGFAIMISLTIGLIAFLTFLQIGSVDGIEALDVVRALFILISTTWLAWGAIQGFIGLTTSASYSPPAPRSPIKGRTIVLMPVYNEDPQLTMSRLAAMEASLREADETVDVHFAVLSDTRSQEIAKQEEALFVRLVEEAGGEGRIFYRRRTENTGKKAGNIEDFIVRSGGAYDYALILDADSLMEGETILEMVRRMEEDPHLGLLQTLPKIIRAQSRFGRAMQFAASFYSPVFCRGLAMMQGRTGPFWGHNAIVRVSAFAQSCGLPVLRGDPPFGGHIMSHDYVEAALLARSGWKVRVDDDLGGSYEEGPENIVEHAKRDRRWCQGNLQHGRLILAPRLRPWSRFVFVQGIMAYIAPLFWMGFLIASIATPYFTAPPNYFPEPNWPIPYIPPSMASETITLFIGIFGLLFLPKLMVALKASLSGQARLFGGSFRVFSSTIWELAFSSIIAPIMMMYAIRSVFQVVAGRDGGWPTNKRGDGQLTLGESFAASSWISLVGLVGLAVTSQIIPQLLLWLLPVCLPMAFAPVILWLSSKPGSPYLYAVPSEFAAPAVVALHDRILENWQSRPLIKQDDARAV